MSLDPGSRIPSPLSSGRSSPQPRRRNDDEITKRDPKYKRYSANIDRALSLFESATLQEWADYISFLGRLLKALQSHPSLPLIPSKTLIATRLAQCLNPRLPSGVHQKTIEVYSYIFSLIGRDGLSADLTLWTPGLTPVLSYASLTLKPHYLTLLETFYLPLGTALRPALKSIILALLPGIDEEGGEYFDRTLGLMDSVREGVEDDAYFWQCFLLATVTSPARRQGALAFLGRRLPRLDGRTVVGEEETAANGDTGEVAAAVVGEVEALVNPDPGLLIRAFCAGLSGEQLLVQRGFLDVLVGNLPLSSKILQERVSKADLQLLVTSAAGVVLRRDMSLNRRLWAWFLGPEAEQQHSEYFEKFGLKALTGGLVKMLDHPGQSSATERAKPYRIALSLMDRWEVGSLVVPRLFLPVVESVRSFEKKTPNKELYAEVLKSASMFFDGVEAGLIWGMVLERISHAFLSEAGNEDDLEAVRFLIRTFNVQEEEMVLVHAPMSVLALLVAIGSVRENSKLSRKGFILAEEIWELVPERAFRSTSSFDEKDLDGPGALQHIKDFYGKSMGRNTDGTAKAPPFSIRKVGEWILREAARATQNSSADGIHVRSRLLVSMLLKTPHSKYWKESESENLISHFIEIFASNTNDSNNIPFLKLQGTANLVSALYARSYLSSRQINSLITPLVKNLWSHLSPDTPKFHVEAVKALWNLQFALGDRRIEAAVADVMTEKNVCSEAEAGRKFGVLWMHSVGGGGGTPAGRAGSISGGVMGTGVGSMYGVDSGGYEVMLTRPVFLLLDALNEGGMEGKVWVRGWVQNLTSINKLFNIFVTKLLGFEFIKDSSLRNSNGAPVKRHIFGDDDDIEVATYYLQTLSNVLQYATGNVHAALASEHVIGTDESRKNLLIERGYGDEDISLQIFFAKFAIRAVDGDAKPGNEERIARLRRTTVSVLQYLLQNPYSKPLAELELENILTARLISAMETADTFVQVSLLDVLFAALQLSLTRPTSHLGHLRGLSVNTIKGVTASRGPIPPDPEKVIIPAPQATPPQQLVRCLVTGFSSPSSRPVLDSWINFLAGVLPLLADVVFQVLMPLVECLCIQIRETFERLKKTFQDGDGGEDGHVLSASGVRSPEGTLVALLNGLEQILAAAHDKLVTEEIKSAGPKSQDTPQGFFGNMVSGVFAVESPQNRSSAANNRLTVLLCFQDTVRICYSIWSWGDVSMSGCGELDGASRESWGYTSMRMRGRARKILEHMFAAETLECLETLIEIWPSKNSTDKPSGPDEKKTASIFKLINVLDGSRPKHTIPAIFNAIYSRTNPSVLDPSRKSTLTAELTDLDVVVFLVEYARSLEDDAMDEIWADCMVFLRDVLANPFPHRQTLPSLLSFTAILGEKVDNTNFGEQKKMRKELGDLFLRLLTAAFTVRPLGGSSMETPVQAAGQEREFDGEKVERTHTRARSPQEDIMAILASIVPELRKVLVEPDRVISASVTISTSVIGPTFRSKSFPQNITSGILELLYQLTRLQNNQKSWKKELSDAFLDPKFFSSPPSLVRPNWVPLARQYLVSDRERMADLLARITPPTTAGVLFGVGATSARMEADKKTQLNLKRIAFLIFAAEKDTFVVNLTELEDKIVELLSATAVTSPSSATRADVYLVIRALVLRTSAVHLSTFWPLINTELQTALSSLFPDEDPNEVYNDFSVLAACKLLDTLLVISPDEFQLHEWLFVTDTIEAVYRSHTSNPVALVDQIAKELSPSTNDEEEDSSSYSRNRSNSINTNSHNNNNSSNSSSSSHNNTGLRKPWLATETVSLREMERNGGDVRNRVLRPFLANLSIFNYERTYGMGVADVGACEDGVVADLFEEVVG